MLDYLFSFRGRAGRLSYFFFFFAWLLIFAGFIVASVVFDLISPVLLRSLFVMMFIAMCVSSIAITVRRLHDMDLSGWIILVPTLLMLVLFFSAFGASFLGYEIDTDSMSEPFMWGAYGLEIFTQLFYLMLFLWPGSEDINRFES